MAKFKITPFGQWIPARRAITLLATRIAPSIIRATRQEADFGARKLRTNLRTQGRVTGQRFDRLLNITKKTRRLKGIPGNRPLMAHRMLHDAIRSKKLGVATYFVGVPPGSRNNKGRDLEKIAEKMEFGDIYAIRRTRQMEKFLGVLYRSAGQKRRKTKKKAPSKGYVVFTIEPRPFISPVHHLLYGNVIEAQARFQTRILRNIGGTFAILAGRPPK